MQTSGVHVLDRPAALAGLDKELDVFLLQTYSTELGHYLYPTSYPTVSPIQAYNKPMDSDFPSFQTSSSDDLSTLRYQLQTICSAIRPYQVDGQTQYTTLPMALMMEVAEVYERYGNCEMLSRVIHIPVEIIQAWHAEYRNRESAGFSEESPIIAQNFVVKREREEALTREINIHKAKTPKDIRKLMPSYVYRRLLALKAKVYNQIITRKKQHQRALLTPQLTQEAIQIIRAVGSVKIVAQMLGVDEGMLNVWKEATETSHVAGRYKLN